jgi:hypothetical protein
MAPTPLEAFFVREQILGIYRAIIRCYAPKQSASSSVWAAFPQDFRFIPEGAD